MMPCGPSLDEPALGEVHDLFPLEDVAEDRRRLIPSLLGVPSEVVVDPDCPSKLTSLELYKCTAIVSKPCFIPVC